MFSTGGLWKFYTIAADAADAAAGGAVGGRSNPLGSLPLLPSVT